MAKEEYKKMTVKSLGRLLFAREPYMDEPNGLQVELKGVARGVQLHPQKDNYAEFFIGDKNGLIYAEASPARKEDEGLVSAILKASSETRREVVVRGVISINIGEIRYKLKVDSITLDDYVLSCTRVV